MHKPFIEKKKKKITIHFSWQPCLSLFYLWLHHCHTRVVFDPNTFHQYSYLYSCSVCMHGSHAGQYNSIISLIMKLRTLKRLPQISGIFVFTTTDLWFAGWRRGGFVAMPPRPQYKIIACYCYIRTWNRRCDLTGCKALLRRR